MFKRFFRWIKRIFKRPNKPITERKGPRVPIEVPTSSEPSAPMRGKKFIDISHWVDIDFDKLKISNVIMKATEGGNFIDSKFKRNLDDCKRTNKRYGFYHYYKVDVSPDIQASHFIDTVGLKELSECYHLPVIDLELGGNHSEGRIKDSLSNVRIFAQEITSKTGRRCRVYSNDGLMGYLAEEFKRLGFQNLCENPWVARYPREPKNFAPWPKLWAHQFSESAKIKGSVDKVDLNIFK